MGVIYFYYEYEFKRVNMEENPGGKVYMAKTTESLLSVEDYDKIVRLDFHVDISKKGDLKFDKLPDKLPTNLKYLECAHNNITELPELPDSLNVLKCSRNKIKKLPNKLPTDIRYIDICHNDLVDLPVCLLDNVRKLSDIYLPYWGYTLPVAAKCKREKYRFTCNGNYLNTFSYFIFNNNPVCEIIRKFGRKNTYNQKLVKYLDARAKNAVRKIENWYLDCKWNPKYKKCRDRLKKEYNEFYCEE